MVIGSSTTNTQTNKQPATFIDGLHTLKVIISKNVKFSKTEMNIFLLSFYRIKIVTALLMNIIVLALATYFMFKRFMCGEIHTCCKYLYIFY